MIIPFMARYRDSLTLCMTQEEGEGFYKLLPMHSSDKLT